MGACSTIGATDDDAATVGSNGTVGSTVEEEVGGSGVAVSLVGAGGWEADA